MWKLWVPLLAMSIACITGSMLTIMELYAGVATPARAGITFFMSAVVLVIGFMGLAQGLAIMFRVPFVLGFLEFH